MASKVIFLFLSLFLALRNVNAGSDGIIGFGLSLYQDQCCQACYDSLSILYLTCTTIDDSSMDMDMGMEMRKRDDMANMPMGTTSPECYANNTAWLQTMAYCIKSNCDAHGYPANKQPACFSAYAVASASIPTFQESLPSVAPTIELEADAMWLNVTSLVNSDTYYSTYGTEAEFARSEYIHTRYSVILYLITIGLIIGAGLLTQARVRSPGLQKSLATSRTWAKLQQYIFLPALFGSRRMEPLPGRAGYVPGRILSTFVTLYVIMNVVLCSVSFRSFQPNIFWASTGGELCEYVGNRTGTLSVVNMSMAILFAGRNNILILITGWNQTTFLILHRWSARVATVQAVVHSIVYTMQYFEPGMGGAAAYVAKAAEPFYYSGIIATIAMCLAAAQSMLPLRYGWYETFLITHIALVILVLVTCWYHLVPHFGLIYGYQIWLYICFAFWGFDRFVRVVRMVWYNHIGESTAVVEAIPGCNVLQVTLFPRTWSFGPGQHSFLYLPDSSLYLPGLGAKFWENHPFSVAGWKRKTSSVTYSSTPASVSDSTEKGDASQDLNIAPVSSGSERSSTSGSLEERIAMWKNGKQIQDYTSIQFLIRVHSGMTAALQKRVLASPFHCVEVSMYTEGPYAGHKATLHPFFSADTILLIIGGIGITSALGFLQEYSDNYFQGRGNTSKKTKTMQKATRIILAWSAREVSLIDHVKSNFLSQYDNIPGVELLLWCTGPNDAYVQTGEDNELQSSPSRTLSRVTNGKMDIRSVMRSSAEAGLQTTVMVCGPGRMVDEAGREAVSCVSDGLRLDLVEETFGW